MNKSVFPLTLAISTIPAILLPLWSIASILPSPKTPPVAVEFDPPDSDAPDNREGSSSRTLCPETDLPLTALVPPRASGLTVSPHPTFWFYIPYRLSHPIEFILFDNTDAPIYRTVVTHTGEPELVSFSLPNNEPPLEIGQRYRWQLSFLCNPRMRTEDDYVSGSILRREIDKTLQQQLDTATDAIARAEVYAERGFWYDTLTTLARLRRDRPHNQTITLEWRELLESVNLEPLADKDIRE